MNVALPIRPPQPPAQPSPPASYVPGLLTPAAPMHLAPAAPHVDPGDYLVAEEPQSSTALLDWDTPSQTGQDAHGGYEAAPDVDEPSGGYDTAPQVSIFDRGNALSPEDIVAAQMLMQVIADDESTEVIINGPSEVLQKVRGQRFHIPNITFKDAETYHRVINEYLLPFCDTQDRIDGKNIRVSGAMELPSDEEGVPSLLGRVHILCPPLVQYAKVTIAKKNRYEYDLDGIAATGAMTPAMAEWLKAVAYGRLTVVVSGHTGAGKTTVLQAMTRHYDQNERIVVIEDVRELYLPLADVIYLETKDPKPGDPVDMAPVSAEMLVRETQRMRINRVIVGECRGAEVAEWLIAANSGLDGSSTTVHADSPRRALDKILGLATKSPTAASEPTLRREIAATVDIVVQASLLDERYVITHIEEVSRTVRQDGNGLIATQTLFEFDRARGVHVVRSRPSDDLVKTLALRGVPVSQAWFRNSQA